MSGLVDIDQVNDGTVMLEGIFLNIVLDKIQELKDAIEFHEDTLHLLQQKKKKDFKLIELFLMFFIVYFLLFVVYFHFNYQKKDKSNT